MARLLVLLMLVAACTPEIGPDTYFCGPERFCPPDLVCDDNSFSCVADFQAESFSCPEGSEMFEPDDSRADGAEVGNVVCGDVVVTGLEGCIVGDDADYVMLENDLDCNGTDPHFEIKVRFPVATAALIVEVLDADGEVLTTAEDCTPAQNFSGREHRCAAVSPETGATYFVRIRIDPEAGDCDGDCRHNQYLLDISYPLS
jgi:hypothetical protein